MLTGEYLFDPKSNPKVFTRDDDHMAQIIELLDDPSLEFKMGGRFSSKIFNSNGESLPFLVRIPFISPRSALRLL